MVAVLSTYRLQLRGTDTAAPFTFADAEHQLDYLAALGVSHLYLSPILTAAPGSTHGYDVTDPTTVSAALGGADGLARLSASARARGMGLIVDIVPNHVGVDLPQHNPWWWDVLRAGRSSAFASYFDIDWDADPGGRILLPVLGSADDLGQLRIDVDVLRLGDKEFPIAPGTGAGSPRQVHDQQHYRLTDWRTGICGYRRFFSVTSLAALRQEDPDVFAASHVEILRWFDEGLVDGLRIDHPDGLADPAGYLRRLRDAVGPDVYLVVEKILAAGEALEPTLPVAGSTGYDALREIGGLFIDPAGRAALTASAQAVGFHRDADTVRDLKTAAATTTLAGELARLHRAVATAAGAEHPLLGEAIAALLSNIGVYRCDYPGLSAVLSTAIAAAVAERPELDTALTLLAAALRHPEPAARLQQLCGAVTAKAVEDCLFYRDPTLVALNEVGGAPERFSVSAAEFHHSAAVRARHWPSAMTTLSTHDTKRGEDVRARIGVLSQIADQWAALVEQWLSLTPPPDDTTGLFLWQNMFGVWPVSGDVDDRLRRRLHAYAEKAIREAAVHTTWASPAADFEAAVHAWLDEVIDGPVGVALGSLASRVEAHAHSDALGQKLVALTAPGVPDVYQGTELWEDSLVDPDNRRPVDFDAAHTALSAETHPKLRVVRAALQLRRARPDSFLPGGFDERCGSARKRPDDIAPGGFDERCGSARKRPDDIAPGGFTPLPATGNAAEHLVAFRRGADVAVAVTRWPVRLSKTGWGRTVLGLPTGLWHDRITGVTHSGMVPPTALFAELPVALLERVDD